MGDIISVDASAVVRLGLDMLAHSYEVQDRAEQVVAKTAYDVQAMMQVDSPVDTGYLKTSHTTDVDGLEAETGPTADYAHYVHDGTSRQAPQPWSNRAVDTNGPRFEQAIEQLGGGIVGRGRRR